MGRDYQLKVNKRQLLIRMTAPNIPATIRPMVEDTNTETLLSRNITALMQIRGVTPRPFAKLVPVSHVMMHRYMRGEARPRPEKLDKIADLLGVSAAELEYGHFTSNVIVTSPNITITQHDEPMPEPATPPDRTTTISDPRELASWLIAQGDDALADFLRGLADTLQKKK
ncbi:hypothetical protein CFN79_10895 [Chromobacterium vaccinii]|nr:hypothetical protein CFN79_10895 [Chromobacterium vaccinii]